MRQIDGYDGGDEETRNDDDQETSSDNDWRDVSSSFDVLASQGNNKPSYMKPGGNKPNQNVNTIPLPKRSMKPRCIRRSLKAEKQDYRVLHSPCPFRGSTVHVTNELKTIANWELNDSDSSGNAMSPAIGDKSSKTLCKCNPGHICSELETKLSLETHMKGTSISESSLSSHEIEDGYDENHESTSTEFLKDEVAFLRDQRDHWRDEVFLLRKETKEEIHLLEHEIAHLRLAYEALLTESS